MENQKRFSISEPYLNLLLEQVKLQPAYTADFILNSVKNDLRIIEKEEVEDDKA